MNVPFPSARTTSWQWCVVDAKCIVIWCCFAESMSKIELFVK